MTKEYFIDGNNLIGKIPAIMQLQKKDKQSSREKLAYIVDTYFFKKKPKATIFFDGFRAEAIPTSKIRIEYCDKRTADEDIKRAIIRANNPKLITVVSSDFSVMGFARASSCMVIKSEEFAKLLEKKDSSHSEEARIKKINNDEIKKLFGV